jgi:nicotinamide mononucleotide transporter
MDIFHQFIDGLLATRWYEFVAVVFGIVSVWLSKKENILVYPIGLVNTILYVFISLNEHLIGEATVNFYYTVMSIYGWLLWSKKDVNKKPALHISFSPAREWVYQILFFLVFYIGFFFSLSYLKKEFYPGALPAADAFASATAFTGMWLMARKRIEAWYWYIATNIASIPLYFVKGLVFTSFYYLILLILAISGLVEWLKKVRKA